MSKIASAKVKTPADFASAKSAQSAHLSKSAQIPQSAHSAEFPQPSADSASQGYDNIDTQIAQLDEAVEWFYGDDFSLSQAVEKYQSAIKLAENIDRSLDQLENQVEVLSIDFAKE